MILELTQPWPVETPKGPGLALLVLDYGPEHHLMLTVGLDATGEIWTFEGPEVRLQPNRTLRAPRSPSGEAAHHIPEAKAPGPGSIPRHPKVGHYLDPESGDCVACGARREAIDDNLAGPCITTSPPPLPPALPPLPYKV